MSSRVWWWAWARAVVDKMGFVLAGMALIGLKGFNESLYLMLLVIVSTRVWFECGNIADKEEREHGSV